MTISRYTKQNSDSKPRERLLNNGSSFLSDQELIAILLSTGSSNQSVMKLSSDVLAYVTDIKNLVKNDVRELMKIKGIGLAKASKLKAAAELSLRISIGSSSLKTVLSPEDAYNIMRKELYKKAKEHLYVLSLNSKGGLISKELISIGTANETVAHPRDIFKVAILHGAVSIILIHNHPSNDPTPSHEDEELTKRIQVVADLMGIRLMDHIIVCDNSYLSLKSLGVIESSKTNESKQKGGE